MPSTLTDITSNHPRSVPFANRLSGSAALCLLHVLAGCSGQALFAQAPAASHLFADYEIVEVSSSSADSSSSLSPGTLLRFSRDELIAYRDARHWARIGADWLNMTDEEQLLGAYQFDGDIEVRELNGAVSISENGEPLAVAVPLASQVGIELLNSLPSQGAIQEQAEACLQAYAQAQPDDLELLSMTPKSLRSTATVLALVHLAKARLERAHLPIPTPCETSR